MDALQLLVVPFLGFCVAHVRNTANRPNRRAIRVGWLLFFVSLALLVSGVAPGNPVGLLVD